MEHYLLARAQLEEQAASSIRTTDARAPIHCSTVKVTSRVLGQFTVRVSTAIAAIEVEKHRFGEGGGQLEDDAVASSAAIWSNTYRFPDVSRVRPPLRGYAPSTG